LTRPWAFALQVGFFAGLIWGLAGCVAHYFGFTEVKPSAWAGPWLAKGLSGSWRGTLAGLAAYVALSVLAALLYAAVLRRARGPWPGVAYGILWFAALFFMIGPALGVLPSWRGLSVHTLVAEGCRFLLWGGFIGYSVAMEFTDERVREPGMG